MPSLNSLAVHDMVQQLVDTLDMETDLMARLHHYAYLGDEYRRLVIPHRDAAAYAARVEYPIADVARATNMDAHTIIRWCGCHRERTGAPGLPRHDMPSVDGAIDLSGLARRGKQ